MMAEIKNNSKSDGDHPRDEEGRFTEKGSLSGSQKGATNSDSKKSAASQSGSKSKSH